ncbi:MAG: LPS export ABC transporter periplasmic protein LptC [Bacteroidota bacterium]|nr:LPS export ABC transporter periplasmic protein LptC [Bacteroidota bacterium]MDP4234585.1 LPS export ABC transporter periplasmic protein LptC [Bacteroidota bacterium]MDP4243714.1 LPS export ABC transporter periplasmic protein LptC [Bacteroidota bacterium]MDP4288338.1 LPS export ABC transporter periplasmic protein LptC [Bacteroidota bacterium]
MRRLSIIVGCVVGLSLTLGSCDEGPKVMPGTTQNGIRVPVGLDKPTQVSYNTSMNFSSSGMLRAILHAGRIQQFDTKRYTWLDSSVKVDFYNRDGKHSTILTSMSARVNQLTNNMTAYGHVHIVSDSGTVVDTDSLEWLNKEQTLHSDAAVHIVEPNGRITDGVGFESDQNLEHYHILHPVILAPSGALESGSRTNEKTLKPQEQPIPGAGAFGGAPRVQLPVDTIHRD